MLEKKGVDSSNYYSIKEIFESGFVSHDFLNSFIYMTYTFHIPFILVPDYVKYKIIFYNTPMMISYKNILRSNDDLRHYYLQINYLTWTEITEIQLFGTLVRKVFKTKSKVFFICFGRANTILIVSNICW